ncbi:baseplate wedge protein [Gordonia phage Pupper]|uniref:Baseplate wedge protein n=1 Tax=Gordonia phage Pupper TaxID=2571249 RepID=A0A4Y6EKP5_9CAUD|nr:baseplate protein [Gordonia phage Pupper]QDF18615.1 baseplate wedge protein [Gordonia phage Pupper]QDF18847.1 baseplate wedge protein [Gordonia phage SCentae]
MSFSLAVVNGDLAQQGSTLDIVFGADKLKQDVDLWLRERFGGDRFHRNMGSILQDFVGDVVSPQTESEIQSEVLRVLQNYQSVQYRRLKENPQSLSHSELLLSVDSIKTQVNYDTVIVTVRLRNGSGTLTTVSVASTL